MGKIFSRHRNAARAGFVTSRTDGSAKGFTLIELSLAIAFISVLMLSIGVITLNIISIYQKGLTIRALNSTGRLIVDDMKRSVAGGLGNLSKDACADFADHASAYSKCLADKAKITMYQQYYATININGTNRSVPVYGVLCTGTSSYVWNTGYAIGASTDLHATVTANGSDLKDFRLLKFSDPTRNACRQNVNFSTYEANYSKVNVGSEYEEMLGENESNLAIFDLQIYSPSEDEITAHTFVPVSIIMATVTGGVDIMGNGDYCKDPGFTLAADFNYCAVNKFNFSVQAIGKDRR